jgi:hypothetical protein
MQQHIWRTSATAVAATVLVVATVVLVKYIMLNALLFVQEIPPRCWSRARADIQLCE